MQKYTIKKIAEDSIDWKSRTHGKYREVVKTINSLKIGEAVSVEGLPKSAGGGIVKASYKQVKGVYKLYTKRIGSISYFRKAER